MKSIFRIASLILMVSFLAACAQPTAAPVAPEAASSTVSQKHLKPLLRLQNLSLHRLTFH